MGYFRMYFRHDAVYRVFHTHIYKIVCKVHELLDSEKYRAVQGI